MVFTGRSFPPNFFNNTEKRNTRPVCVRAVAAPASFWRWRDLFVTERQSEDWTGLDWRVSGGTGGFLSSSPPGHTDSPAASTPQQDRPGQARTGQEQDRVRTLSEIKIKQDRIFANVCTHFTQVKN